MDVYITAIEESSLSDLMVLMPDNAVLFRDSGMWNIIRDDKGKESFEHE